MGTRPRCRWFGRWLILALLAGACATRAPTSPRTTLGVASWYGPGFHGRPTANGETYDQNGLTAAHRTWPLGTPVRVTHLGNGKSVLVRVNDRGPFVDGREIDLSYGAARRLDMVQSGTARVRLEPLPDRHGVSRAVRFAVQVGSFREPQRADARKTQIAGIHGIERPPLQPSPRGIYIAQGKQGGAPLYRVRVGPCANRAQAERLASAFQRAGMTSLVVEEVVRVPSPARSRPARRP